MDNFTSRPRRTRVWIAAATAATTAGLLAVTAAAYAGETPAVTPNAAVAPAVDAPPPGFSLTWSDDFTGGAGTGVNTGSWKYDTPGRAAASAPARSRR